MNRAAFIVSVVLFVLAGLGFHFSGVNELDLISFGLAAFALGHAA